MFDKSPTRQNRVKCSILFQQSWPNLQTQNEVAESKHPHILKAIRTFLIQSLLSSHFQGNSTYAVLTQLVTFLHNLFKVKSPYEKPSDV